MELRPSGKIAVGIIAALGTIGALHILIFKPRAQEYGQAKAGYDQIVSQYTQQGTTPDINEMYRFRYLSLKHRLEFWRGMDGLRVFLPDFHAPGATDDPLFMHRQAVWSAYRRMQEIKTEGTQNQLPKLTFLANRQGQWDFRDGLPDQIVQRNIAVEDIMNYLRNSEATLRAIGSQTTQAYLQGQVDYDRTLAQLGVDVNYRTWLQTNFGAFAGTLYTLNRIDHVLKNLPEDFFPGMGEKERLQEMYRLFKMEWPKNAEGNEDFFMAQRQAEGLIHVLEVARQEGVEEISYVRFHDIRPIHWRDFAEEQAATPTPAAMGGFAGGGGEEFFMDDMDIYGAGGGKEGFEGVSRFGGAAATPVPAGEFVATGVPIEVMAVGSNAAVTSFLYRISHGRNPLELDKLQIQSMGADGRVRALAYINVVGFGMFTLGDTEADINRHIVTTQREMADLALNKLGATELALQDGFVVRNEQGALTLSEPTPTAVPTPEGQTPTPAPVTEAENYDM